MILDQHGMIALEMQACVSAQEKTRINVKDVLFVGAVMLKRSVICELWHLTNNKLQPCGV